MEGALILKRSFLVKYAKVIFILSVLSIFLIGIYYSWNLYSVWLSDPVTAALLPPATPIDYFFFYVLMWYFAPYVLSLLTAFVFFLVCQIGNKKSEERFFEKEELWIAATTIFLCKYPGWLVYLACLIAVYLFIHLFSRLKSFFGKKELTDTRLSLYHLWLPVAILSLLACEFWLSKMPWWFKFVL